LIDLSGSTRDVVSLIRGAALRFINAARPFDRIGVITFAGRPTVVSPLTLDRQALRQRVNAIDTEAGDTKLYDATDFALTQLLRDTKNARRTAVVLMSDGLDGSIPGVQGDGRNCLTPISSIEFVSLMGCFTPCGSTQNMKRSVRWTPNPKRLMLVMTA